MAYGDKKRGRLYGMVNNNPWTRQSQKTQRIRSPRQTSQIPKMDARSLNLSSILTGRRSAPQRGGTAPATTRPMQSSVEKRGGARRAPFLSNTGPGKKRGY